MSLEEKDKNFYTINDGEKIDFEKSGNDFGFMPEEFFNSKYQQSRVRKEQQMQKEKELIDKKKKEKEEKLKRLSELEQLAKEKYELKRERERIKQEEKNKKQEEIDFINKKKSEKREKLLQEKLKQKEKQDLIKRKKLEKDRKIREINQKSREERKKLKQEQKELLKIELEKRAAILRSKNLGTNDFQKNKEVEKALSKERFEILRKIKLEQKLNKKEQDKIKKELKEEERLKLENAKKEALAKAKLDITKYEKKSINLDFVDDDRVSNIEKNKNKKKRVIISVYVVIGCFFVIFVLFQTKIINLKNNKNNIDNINNSNIIDDYSIRLNDKASFSKEVLDFNNNIVNYFVKFNDRRDIDNINFNVLNSEQFGVSTYNLGIFSFGKVSNLNNVVNVTIDNISCDNDLYLNYFDETKNQWVMFEKIVCENSSLVFNIKNNLVKYYSVSSSDGIKNINGYKNFNLDLNYWYEYGFSKFINFFKYNIDAYNKSSYLSKKELDIYNVKNINKETIDSDGDSFVDGEEVINLYDPVEKNINESRDLKLFDSNKIALYNLNSISFYYPIKFIKPFNLQESIIISPDVDSLEFISIDILKKDRNLSFVDFVSYYDKSSEFYLFNQFFDVVKNNFYINNFGNIAYLDIGNDSVLKISYLFDSKDSINYISTFLMILNSVSIF